MRCPKCNEEIKKEYKHCLKCGYMLNKNNPLKMILIGILFGVGASFLGILIVNLFMPSNKYYFRDKVLDEIGIESSITGDICERKDGTIDTTKSSTTTSIVSDNTYVCEELDNEEMATKLIKEDSIAQKDNCSEEILEIEETFIKKYGITAVNLCEMDVEFASELEKVFGKIYNEYPKARGYLTNISLKNETIFRSGVIASFLPIFSFADINSSDYQLVIKTQMFLSSSYFLNPEKLKSATMDASNSGHFPKNATIYSPVAHEMGHYLSFIALLKDFDVSSILLIDTNHYSSLSEIGIASKSGDFSLSMLEEAYKNYQQDTKDSISFDEWRGQISNYALAKDNGGNYIYDETVAEAFHDVYLNGDNATSASKYIVAVLKEKLQ